MNPSDIVNNLSKKDKFLHLLVRYNLALPFSERRMLLFVGDLLILYLAGVLTLWGRTLLQDNFTFGALITREQIVWLVVLGAIWVIVALVNECYDLKIADQPRVIIKGLMITTLVVGLLYLFIFFVLGRPVAEDGPSFLARWSFLINPLYQMPRIIPATFLLLSWPLVTLWRVGYIHLSTRFPLRRRALIVGAGKSGQALMRALQQPMPGYEIIGFIDDDPSKRGATIAGLPVLGNRHTLLKEVKFQNVNEIILAITQNVHDDLFRAIMDCYEQGTVIKPMAQLYEDSLGRIPVEHLGQQSLLIPFWSNINHPTFYRVAKRLIDIFIALLGLTLMVILLPFIALAIYFNSPGPIFYGQARLGKGGRHFKLYKFRSMVPDAEPAGEAVWAAVNDARITPVGKFLRQTRLDELPQLINVLKGEMSIVGPRPERPEFIARLQESIPFYRTRLSVKPGLTGWAQVQYRYGNTVKDALIKLEYDLFYIKNRSLVLDLLITLRTIKVMLTLKGT